MPSSQKNEELAVIFDIGSGSIGGALVLLPIEKPDQSFDLLTLGFEENKKQKPKVLFTTRSQITFGENFNSENFLVQMTKALTDVAGKIEAVHLGAPVKAYCFLASPWQASQARIIRQNRYTPFILTSKMLSELVEKEINLFGQMQADQHTALGENIQLLNTEIMQVKLNGYKTSDRFGKKAKEMETALFVSISPDRVLGSLKYHIEKFFSLDVKFYSFPFVSFVVSRDIFPNESNFLIVDIAGELTDITLIKDEILEESISFPRGKNYFVRELGRRLNKNTDESKTLMNLFLSGRAEKKISENIKNTLKISKNDWLRSFGESLLEISSNKSLPTQVYLAADPEIANWIKSIIEEDQLHQYTVTESKFNVTILKSESLGQFAALGPKAHSDSFLILESIFINRVR